MLKCEKRSEKMDMFKEARALAVTMEMRKLSQSEMAKSLGVSPSYISNKLRLLGLSEEMQKQISENHLTERHARALLRLDGETEILNAVEKITAMKLSVAQTEALIDTMLDKKLPKMLDFESPATGIARFEEILRKSMKSLKGLGIEVDVMTSFFGRTKYITIAIPE